MLRIGIVCYPSLGGSGVLATELGHALAKRGHKVHFITYEPPFRLRLDAENLYFHQVQMSRYELMRYPDYALALAVKIADICTNYDLDILHVHYAIPHATSAFLARQLLGKSRPAIVTTLHGTDITLVGRDPAYYEIVKFSIEKSDAVTAVSKDLKRKTIDYFAIKRPIEVIYNFFIPRTDYACQVSSIRQRLTPRGEKLLVHASNFRHVKRVDDVIAIFERVRKTIEARLFLVGEGAGFEEAQREVAMKGLDEEVFFAGKQASVDAYIASSDLFLLPSSQESFGLAALEAMAYGVPVIASRVGGLPEVVEDGVGGLLFACGAVDAMAEAAISLLTDDKKRLAMGKAAKKRADTHFNVKQILPQYEALYQSLQINS